uniref:Uncharacterized protein n=1 Tax=Tanacetum cinerariifolium TaxID=118510 RepID=A0A699VCT5_TANCI|nr:hypothetical protein [Tanacetum cinerariifolium]
METMNVSFDELSVMAFEQRSSKPGLQCMTSAQISSGLDLNYAPSTIMTQQPTEGDWMYYLKLCMMITLVVNRQLLWKMLRVLKNLKFVRRQRLLQQDVDELNPNAMVDGNTFFNPFANSSTSAAVASSSS